MGRLIDTSNIRVKPQYMQDVIGIAMIRCEDLSRILADAPTVEAIPKDQYEARLKADMVAMLADIQLEIEEHKITSGVTNQGTWNECIACCSRIIQQKINALKENTDDT